MWGSPCVLVAKPTGGDFDALDILEEFSDGIPIASRQRSACGLAQLRQLPQHIVEHPVVLAPRALRGIHVEAGAVTEVITVCIGHGVAPRAGIWRDGQFPVRPRPAGHPPCARSFRGCMSGPIASRAPEPCARWGPAVAGRWRNACCAAGCWRRVRIETTTGTGTRQFDHLFTKLRCIGWLGYGHLGLLRSER